jgi:hypothetical protein
MRIALVGSSIHGDLLSPNDKDIAIECHSIQDMQQYSLGARGLSIELVESKIGKVQEYLELLKLTEEV